MEDNKLRLYEAETGNSRTLVGHTAPISGLAFSRDHATLFSADRAGKVIAWNTQSGARAMTLNVSDRPIQGIVLANHDTELLAAADGCLLRWKRDAPKTMRAVPLQLDYRSRRLRCA